MTLSLTERLDRIRSPNLQNQKETVLVLSSIEGTLETQGQGLSPTSYFAILLNLLKECITGPPETARKAIPVIYLLDIVTQYVPKPILRIKFSQILEYLTPALTQEDVEAPLLRHSLGCLETVLISQEASAWNLSQTQTSPRLAVTGILTLVMDKRPKVRKRALEALTNVLKSPPPSPLLDHPVADMCAESALSHIQTTAQTLEKRQKLKGGHQSDNHPELIHALQLVKAIASVSNGWPSKRIDLLYETLLRISKSSNEYITTTSFEVFETIFAGMADEISSAKLSRLLEAIIDLRPSKDDSQLLPPWIAVLSRGYDVSAQVEPGETFQKMPAAFEMVSSFLTSTSLDVRISASECLISFAATCISANVVVDPSIYEEEVLEKIGKLATDLLSIKYQGAWMEIFNVMCALFDALKWKSVPLLNDVVKTIGELRSNDAFNGKKEADQVLGKAIRAMGPAVVLDLLPLNMIDPKPKQPGRVWLLPLLRDNVANTHLKHFRTNFVPLSEIMFKKASENEGTEKSMQTKIYETVFKQIWSMLPGYCTVPVDLVDSLDHSFAELISNLLYTQTELRADLCKALQLLVDGNKEILASDEEFSSTWPGKITKTEAEKNIGFLATLSGDLLAVLFNIYSATVPQHRGYILVCINSYLSIMSEQEIAEKFVHAAKLLEESLQETAFKPAPGGKDPAERKAKSHQNQLPPTSHNLMDLVIVLSTYLPSSSYPTLFALINTILPRSSDPQLQKKGYKILPRLASFPTGIRELEAHNVALQELLLSSAASASLPARRDRLNAISAVVSSLPPSSLHFIPSILSEVVLSAKEANDRARTAAFDLLVSMGKRMAEGGTIEQSKIPHMDGNAPNANASLQEFLIMVSAGLAGSTPHMISASIIALTRILFEFRQDLPDNVVKELLSTMDLFLTSKSREVIKSVFGFVKFALLSLPEAMIRPRLGTMIPHLVNWSKEHKNHFKARVKNILERAIRRFGYETIEGHCPAEDRKLIHNIQKTRERRKRRKQDGDKDGERKTTEPKRRHKFESEFDEAVYGSESDENGSDSDVSDDRVRMKKHGSKRYIIEDEDEPLDLLDRKALANISTTKPVKVKVVGKDGKPKNKAKTDLDGKLVLGEDDEPDSGLEDAETQNVSLEEGIDAYVKAVKGRDAVRRGRGGRLKFSNKRDPEDPMDVDEEEIKGAVKNKVGRKGSRRGLDGSKPGGAKFRGRIAKASSRRRS